MAHEGCPPVGVARPSVGGGGTSAAFPFAGWCVGRGKSTPVDSHPHVWVFKINLLTCARGPFAERAPASYISCVTLRASSKVILMLG